MVSDVNLHHYTEDYRQIIQTFGANFAEKPQGGVAVQARPCGLKAPWFQTLIVKKDKQCFQLEPWFLSELAPLQEGFSAVAHPLRAPAADPAAAAAAAAAGSGSGSGAGPQPSAAADRSSARSSLRGAPTNRGSTTTGRRTGLLQATTKMLLQAPPAER